MKVSAVGIKVNSIKKNERMTFGALPKKVMSLKGRFENNKKSIAELEKAIAELEKAIAKLERKTTKSKAKLPSKPKRSNRKIPKLKPEERASIINTMLRVSEEFGEVLKKNPKPPF